MLGHSHAWSGLATGTAAGIVMHAHPEVTATLAGLMAWRGYGLPLVPLSCALGCLTHIAGDACTDEGVPALWPLVHGHQHLLPEPFSFTTSTKPERWVVAPGLVLLTTGLALHAAGLPLPHIH